MLYDLLSDALVEKAFTHDALREIRMLQFFSDIFWILFGSMLNVSQVIGVAADSPLVISRWIRSNVVRSWTFNSNLTFNIVAI